jgi:protein TonB
MRETATTNGMFDAGLCFSRPVRERGAITEAFSASVLAHIAVVIAAVWLSVAPPKKQEPEENVIAVMLQDAQKEEELPPPPPPPPASSRVLPQTVMDAPRGFQTLTAPTFITPDIPAPTVGVEIDEADFSGEGVEGGRGRGKFEPTEDRVVTTEDVSAAPVFTPYTVAPTLKNRAEIARTLTKLYPPLMRDAGLGGSVMLWLFIDAAGNVRNMQVKESSGFEPLDSVAVRVAVQMRFTPAQNRDMKVPVWVAIPLVFTPPQ